MPISKKRRQALVRSKARLIARHGEKLGKKLAMIEEISANPDLSSEEKKRRIDKLGGSRPGVALRAAMDALNPVKRLKGIRASREAGRRQRVAASTRTAPPKGVPRGESR